MKLAPLIKRMSVTRPPKRRESDVPRAAASPAALDLVLGLEQMPTESHFRHDRFHHQGRLAAASWRLGLEPLGGKAIELGQRDLEQLPFRLGVGSRIRGHRHAGYEPAPRGVAWQTGAMSEAVSAAAAACPRTGGLCGATSG